MLLWLPDLLRLMLLGLRTIRWLCRRGRGRWAARTSANTAAANYRLKNVELIGRNTARVDDGFGSSARQPSVVYQLLLQHLLLLSVVYYARPLRRQIDEYARVVVVARVNSMLEVRRARDLRTLLALYKRHSRDFNVFSLSFSLFLSISKSIYITFLTIWAINLNNYSTDLKFFFAIFFQTSFLDVLFREFKSLHRVVKISFSKIFKYDYLIDLKQFRNVSKFVEHLEITLYLKV